MGGFTKSYAYLELALRERLNRQSDGLYLYRNMFPTQVPDLCFVGSEVSTFNNILTQGLQALWLRHVLAGQLTLPSVEAMDMVIETERAWKRSWMPKKGDRAAILQLHKMAYHDQLCKDMAVNPRRKGWNILALSGILEDIPQRRHTLWRISLAPLIGGIPMYSGGCLSCGVQSG